MDGLFVVPNLRIVLKLSSRVTAYFAYSVFRNDEMALHFGKEPSFFVVLMKIYRKTMNVKEIENNEKKMCIRDSCSFNIKKRTLSPAFTGWSDMPFK